MALPTAARYRSFIQRVLTLASLYTEREARQNAWEFHDTGALARSITSEVSQLSARIYSTLAYAAVMEEGRRPGARMPPPHALDGWMRRHGMDPRLSFVLARAIARRGIAGRFFMRRAVQSLRTALPGLIEQAAHEVLG